MEKVRSIVLEDSIYSAIGLSVRAGATFKTGAVLIGADAVYRVEDDGDKLVKLIDTSQLEPSEESKEESKEGDEDEFKFVENVVEIESSDALLLVQSDGRVWSLFENTEC